MSSEDFNFELDFIEGLNRFVADKIYVFLSQEAKRFEMSTRSRVPGAIFVTPKKLLAEAEKADATVKAVQRAVLQFGEFDPEHAREVDRLKREEATLRETYDQLNTGLDVLHEMRDYMGSIKGILFYPDGVKPADYLARRLLKVAFELPQGGPESTHAQLRSLSEEIKNAAATYKFLTVKGHATKVALPALNDAIGRFDTSLQTTGSSIRSNRKDQQRVGVARNFMIDLRDAQRTAEQLREAAGQVREVWAERMAEEANTPKSLQKSLVVILHPVHFPEPEQLDEYIEQIADAAVASMPTELSQMVTGQALDTAPSFLP